MKLYGVFSLLSAAAMAVAYFYGTRLRGDLDFVLQLLGYGFFALSAGLSGAYGAAFVLAMCAITLALKMIRRYPPLAGLVCAAVTLVGGLLLNRQGWTGVLPVLAGTGVVFRHGYRYRSFLPTALFPESMRAEMQRRPMPVLSRIDNANRMRGQSHALDLLLENIVAVILWGAYAWLMGDVCMLCWRAVLLLLNLVDYCKRMKRILNRILNGFVPDGSENKRRRYPGQNRKRSWSI